MNASCPCTMNRHRKAKATSGTGVEAGADASRLRRSARALSWLGPGLMLVLMPKCPVCVAGYIAVITGVGISLPAAAAVRMGLIVICLASLAFLAIRRAQRMAAPRWLHRRHG